MKIASGHRRAARRAVPRGDFIPPDFAAYRATSRGLWALVGERLPVVQQLGLDEGYADVTEVPRPLPALRELVAEVAARTGITMSVGVAPNRLIAKVASDLEKPRGFVAMGREEACRRLADRSPRIIPGIGPRRLSGWPRSASRRSARCSRRPRTCSRSASGRTTGATCSPARTFHGSTTVEPDPGPAKSRSSETTFDRDIAGAAELEEVLVRLARELGENLRRDAARGRTVAMRVRLDDWTTVTRTRTLPVAATTARRASGGRGAPARLRAAAPLRLLGVRVASFEEGGASGARRQLALPV